MGHDNANSDEIKGRAKEAVGSITDDDELENEGKMDRMVGDAKDVVDSVADKVRSALGRNG